MATHNEMTERQSQLPIARKGERTQVHVRFAHIRDLLKNQNVIKILIEQRQENLNLLAAVRSHLPDAMRSHCLDASQAEGDLTLYLDSPAWATRARFFADELIQLLNRHRVSRVRIQIRLQEQSTPDDERRPDSAIELSEETARHLLDAANLMHDPELRDVFMRFAQRHMRHMRHTKTEER